MFADERNELQGRSEKRDGHVPDAVTAIKIAVAVWESIYGAEHIATERPYRAALNNGVWIVEGFVT
jgi:hypothetical protein